MEQYEVVIESINKNMDILQRLSQSAEIGSQTNPLAFKKIQDSEEYINAFKNVNTGMHDLVAKCAQSTTFSDTLLSWFGIFNQDLKFIKAKRSELIAKKDVQEYTYERHYWNYTYLANVKNNILELITRCFNALSFALDNAEKKAYPLKEIDTIIADYYRDCIDCEIDRLLYGKKKGLLKERITAYLIGDGIKPVVKKMNFKDEISISTLIDLGNSWADLNFEYFAKMDKAYVADLKNKIKSITDDIRTLSKNPSHADFAAKHVKMANAHIALLLSKLEEFLSADLFSFKTVTSELISILKGLYEYKGR